VLELRSETPSLWAEQALREPLELLLDHAHCELGAAAAAQALVHRYPERTRLLDRMAVLAIEELMHFRQVVACLEACGGEFASQAPSPYLAALHRGAKRTAADPSGAERLLDRLLVAGLVEARSCERFCLLAEHAGDERLAGLYGALGPSERGHAELFPRLAAELFGAERAAERSEVLCQLEADVIAELPFAPRMHSGLPSGC
jgi:tRNA-(ms[2]io[6]A)-hydroxylase